MKYDESTLLEELGLSVRSYNALKQAGVKTFGDLLQTDIYHIRNIGRKSIDEILSYTCPEEAEKKPDKQRKAVFILYKETPIPDLGFSNRLTNGLMRADIKTLGQLLSMKHSIYRIPHIGKKSADEALMFLSSHKIVERKDEEDDIDPYSDYENWCDRHSDLITEIVIKEFDDITEDLPISIRSVNSLLLHKKYHISDYLFLNEFELMDSFDIEEKNAIEIVQYCRRFLREHKDLLIKTLWDKESEPKKEKTVNDYSIKELFFSSNPFRENAIEAIKTQDVSIEQLCLSPRSMNFLKNSRIEMLSDLAGLRDDEIVRLRSTRSKSITEIIQKKWELLNNREALVKAYISGDYSLIYTEERLEEMILALFDSLGFQSLSYRKIKEKLPETLDDDTVKKTIGRMIRKNRLEYVDFRIYRTYMSFFDFLKEYPFKDEKIRYIVEKRFSGLTLEETAADHGLTRERARQITVREEKKIRSNYVSKYGTDLFDEDYYAYLYQTYALDKELMSTHLHIDDRTRQYLNIAYSKGNTSLEKSLLDDKLDLILKTRIRDYMNRGKILINGQLIEKRKGVLEDYVMREYCRDEMNFDRYVEIYNRVLKENRIYEKKLLIDQDTLRTRGNRIPESMSCLWKQGRMLRYYDIAGRDFEELLDTLALQNYKDTQVSTLKFIRLYPELMAKYDIRDQYELHNLLKKIIDPKDYNDIQFNRQPIITFGEFDRKKMAYEAICALSPVSLKDLVNYMEEEYGYEPLVFQANVLNEFSQFYHNGIYSVDFKKIPDDKKDILREKLTQDFYYVDDVKKIYRSLFPKEDIEAINPYSLKSMGFSVNDKYILKNWESGASFFKYLLTKDDITDLNELNKKFSVLRGFHNVSLDVRKDYEVIEFEPGKLINIRRLIKAGYAKEDLRQYCDDVDEFVEEGYFTIASLRKNGFVSKLDELGFDDRFYATILAVDQRFAYTKAFHSVILYKGDRSKEITKTSFISDRMKDYESIDLDSFVDEIRNDYGLKDLNREDVKQVADNTDLYYDSIMDKVYLNERYYYEEFDD